MFWVEKLWHCYFDVLKPCSRDTGHPGVSAGRAWPPPAKAGLPPRTVGPGQAKEARAASGPGRHARHAETRDKRHARLARKGRHAWTRDARDAGHLDPQRA